MKLLRLALFAAGLMCLSALIGLVVPMSAFAKIAQRYGAGPEVRGDFFAYLFRLVSAVIAGCGAFFLVLARDPIRHGALVPVGGAALVFTGATALATGAMRGMTATGYLLDFVGCASLGAVIVMTWLIWGRGAGGG